MTNFIDNNISNGLNISFIGCGNMANAIIAGLIRSGWPEQQIMASNPTPGKLELLTENFNLHTTQDNLQAAEFSDILVLAVKPQKLAGVCRQLASLNLADKLIISVAAGFPIEKMQDAFKQNLSIIRAMPNTPALIGLGATGLFANAATTKEQSGIAQSIFEAVGEATWVGQESHIDIVTGIAGSSPAYFFLMMEAMIEQAVAAGLQQQQAIKLVTQAMNGAAQLAQATPQKPIAQLRKEVTSPGGTTAAAISSFINADFTNIVKQAVNASIQRGQELGAQN